MSTLTFAQDLYEDPADEVEEDEESTVPADDGYRDIFPNDNIDQARAFGGRDYP